MNPSRQKINVKLKEIVIPYLRTLGYTGSFPHLRKINEEKQRIDLITFQFDKYGGGFIVEVSVCNLTGIVTPWGKQIPPNKVRSWDSNFNRYRLGGKNNEDNWFRYDDNSTEKHFIELSNSVVKVLKEELERLQDMSWDGGEQF